MRCCGPRAGGSVTPQATPSTFTKRWNDICTFLNQWYYKPDTIGLLITLAVYRAHFWLDDPPVWLAIIGPPGSGKTEIACGALEALPSVQSESALTTNSFLSGVSEKIGILPNLQNHNGVIVFPDFTTTVLSIDINKRTEISGQLRRIADGAYEKSVGNQEKQLRWRGKVTCIAAGTEDIEPFFDANRDKGDRWTYLRWGSPVYTSEDMMCFADKARVLIGHKATVREEYRGKIYTLMQGGKSKFDPNSINTHAHTLKQLDALAVMLEMLRTSVKREFAYRSGLVLSGIGNMQMPTRTPQNFISLARACSAIRGDTEITDFDLQLPRRVALDSIPSKRRKILDVMLQFRDSSITKSELAMSMGNLGMHRFTFDNVIEDLRALGIIHLIPQEQEDGDLVPLEDTEIVDPNNAYTQRKPKAKDRFTFTPRFSNLLDLAGL